MEMNLPPEDEFLSDMPMDGMDLPPAPPAPPDYSAVVNLVPTIRTMPATETFQGGEQYLLDLGQTVINHKNTDLASSKEYREKRQKHVDLFLGGQQGWTGSQKNIVYVHLPYLTKAILLFHAKMHRNNFPATGDIVGTQVSLPGPEARAREQRTTRHLNWYLRKRVPEYVAEHDRGGMQILIYGDAISVWYFDPREKRWRFEFCGSDDVIVPYHRKPGPADMSDVPRITWLKRPQRHELEELGDPDPTTGEAYYDGVAALFPDSYGPAGEATPGKGEVPASSPSVTQTVEERTGIKPTPASTDGDQPRVILEQDRWLCLPGESRQRPVTVCVDEATGTVLRLVLREKDDARDRARHDRDRMALDAQHDANVQQWNADMDAHRQMVGEVIDPITQLAPPGVMLPPPPTEPQHPDPTFASVTPVRRVPWNRFTHYMCIPNPEGFYGWGIGLLLEGHNITADEVMSLYTSLLRMTLVPTFFYAKMNNRNQDIKLKLGEGNPLPLMPEQLKSAIEWVRFPPPDPNAFKVEERQAKAVQEITADDIIGGAPGLSGQTAAETEIRASNAMDNISMISSRINQSRTNEGQVLADGLAQTLDEEGEAFRDATDEFATEWVVTRDDYVADFDVYVTADPAMASQPQREAKAIKLINALKQLPPETLDPVTMVIVQRAALVKLLRAMGEDEMIPLVEQAQLPDTNAMMGGMPPGGGPNGPSDVASGDGAPPAPDVAPGPGDSAGAQQPA